MNKIHWKSICGSLPYKTGEDDGMAVVQNPHGNTVAVVTGGDYKITKPLADLFSAAPEMYEALKEAISATEYMIRDEEDSEPGWRVHARHIISKAEGDGT